MNQATLHHSDIFASLPDAALSDYFRHAGDRLQEETAVLGMAISHLMQANGYVSNKDIIIFLINVLETTSDVVTNDIIRKTLEIVVGYTGDDI